MPDPLLLGLLLWIGAATYFAAIGAVAVLGGVAEELERRP